MIAVNTIILCDEGEGKWTMDLNFNFFFLPNEKGSDVS
jgi:hypothetical protein